MMKIKPRLLIVEDEEPILVGLTDVFVYHGYDVDSARDGREGLRKALANRYDLIILDLMLPYIDGFSLCNKIRDLDKEQPVIMLTAKAAEEDVITGLTLGADDYVTKPFSVRELVLRVEAVLKRSSRWRRDQSILQIDKIKIDTQNLVQIDVDQPMSFSRREVDILQYLSQNAGRPVTREELLEAVWGYQHADLLETRTVDIHIAKLRRKIETDPKQPQRLVTLRGEGYRLQLQA